MNNKRLYKSSVNYMLCGVCGGIAEYFNIDPTLVRPVISPPILPVSFAERLFHPFSRTLSRIPSSSAISYLILSSSGSSPLR